MRIERVFPAEVEHPLVALIETLRAAEIGAAFDVYDVPSEYAGRDAGSLEQELAALGLAVTVEYLDQSRTPTSFHGQGRCEVSAFPYTEEKRIEMRETVRQMLKDWDRLSTAALRQLGAEAEKERRYETAAALFEEAARRYPIAAGQLAQRDIERLRARAAECRRAALQA